MTTADVLTAAVAAPPVSANPSDRPCCTDRARVAPKGRPA